MMWRHKMVSFFGGAGIGMTGPQEESNDGELCLPLKMRGRGGQRGSKGEIEMEGRG
jgi:hypothetical protein